MWVGLDLLKRDQRESDLHQLSLPICFLAVMRVKNPIRGKKKKKEKEKQKYYLSSKTPAKWEEKCFLFTTAGKNREMKLLTTWNLMGKWMDFFFPWSDLAAAANLKTLPFPPCTLFFFLPPLSVPLVRPAGRPWIGSVMIRRPPQNSDIHMPWAAVLEGKEPCSSFSPSMGSNMCCYPWDPKMWLDGG